MAAIDYPPDSPCCPVLATEPSSLSVHSHASNPLRQSGSERPVVDPAPTRRTRSPRNARGIHTREPRRLPGRGRDGGPGRSRHPRFPRRIYPERYPRPVDPDANGGCRHEPGADGERSIAMRSEGYLNRSSDGGYLIVIGYDAAVGTAGVASSGNGRDSPSHRPRPPVGRAGHVDDHDEFHGQQYSQCRQCGRVRLLVGRERDRGRLHAVRREWEWRRSSATFRRLRTGRLNIFDGQLYITCQHGGFPGGRTGRDRSPDGGRGRPTTNLPGLTDTTNRSPYALLHGRPVGRRPRRRHLVRRGRRRRGSE